ncbi:Transcription factor, MADS-box [Corchorus capsularis]|uniref:Transcription factor, MADS-box n=1 Tax=Corchorus capsularis TaxID=210143 RepID=A0A1R3JGG4_COCAP|nr:Transcription factor, MADS-box [Corchorus capsularis]
MKTIENEDDRLITFSKRRSGIYKKASELTTLCGAEIAFVVFSPAGKAFSFGHPSVESVANRFLNQNPPPNDNTHPLVEAHRKVRINHLTQQHNELLNQLDAEKERAKALELVTGGKGSDGWWETPVDQLKQQDLHDSFSKFAELRNEVVSKLNDKGAAAAPLINGPMDPAQLMANPFDHVNANEEVVPAVFAAPAPGYGPGCQ